MHEPLALEYLGASLKLDAHQVLLLNARIEPNVLSAARRFQPNIVALTTCVRRLKRQYASFSVLTPLPGTAMYKDPQRHLDQGQTLAAKD